MTRKIKIASAILRETTIFNIFPKLSASFPFPLVTITSPASYILHQPYSPSISPLCFSFQIPSTTAPSTTANHTYKLSKQKIPLIPSICHSSYHGLHSQNQYLLSWKKIKLHLQPHSTTINSISPFYQFRVDNPSHLFPFYFSPLSPTDPATTPFPHDDSHHWN